MCKSKSFIEYRFENVSIEICKFLHIAYEENQETKIFVDKLINEFIIPKIEIFEKQAKFFIIETGYIETAWKDMVSLHYINTSYNICPSVARIHLFTEPKLSSDTYLGYFNLRPINEFKIIISYIFPNWDVLRFKNKKDSYMMAYKEKVHIEGIELEISTFPFFAQDGVVASCVHADILMMSLYMHKKYAAKKIKLIEIESSYSYEKKKCYPTNGLEAPQIAEIFNNNKMPIRLFYYRDKIIKDNFQDIIKMYIESGIPVLIGLGSHVILLTGHTLDPQGNYEFIVYDDSGVIVNELAQTKGFVAAVKWQKLEDKLEDFDFIVACEHEKVYMSYIDIKEFIEYQKKMAEEEDINNIKFENENRILLMDNSDVKNSLKQKKIFHFNKNFIDESDSIINKELPHYLWYCETKMNGTKVVYFADPTCHFKSSNSRLINTSVFINKNPFFLKHSLGLLTPLKN